MLSVRTSSFLDARGYSKESTVLAKESKTIASITEAKTPRRLYSECAKTNKRL